MAKRSYGELVAHVALLEREKGELEGERARAHLALREQVAKSGTYSDRSALAAVAWVLVAIAVCLTIGKGVLETAPPYGPTGPGCEL